MCVCVCVCASRYRYRYHVNMYGFNAAMCIVLLFQAHRRGDTGCKPAPEYV